MIQDIITYIIIAVSFIYVIYRLYTSLKKSKKSTGCVGCASCPAKREVMYLIKKKSNK